MSTHPAAVATLPDGTALNEMQFDALVAARLSIKVSFDGPRLLLRATANDGIDAVAELEALLTGAGIPFVSVTPF